MATEYMRVYEHLRSRIQSGEWPVGDKLPGISALEEQYGTSLTTIRTAQQMLVDDGLLATEQGRGAFVISQTLRQASDLHLSLGRIAEQVQTLARAVDEAQRVARDLDANR
jgi:DNA-binding GntR family transcriptional regulator